MFLPVAFWGFRAKRMTSKQKEEFDKVINGYRNKEIRYLNPNNSEEENQFISDYYKNYND